MPFGGVHECEFCGKCVGIDNLIVPSVEVVYVASEMIVHYITDHGYQPPDEFFTALQACPDRESPQYMAILAPYFPYFRVRSPTRYRNASNK